MIEWIDKYGKVAMLIAGIVSTLWGGVKYLENIEKNEQYIIRLELELADVESRVKTLELKEVELRTIINHSNCK